MNATPQIIPRSQEKVFKAPVPGTPAHSTLDQNDSGKASPTRSEALEFGDDGGETDDGGFSFRRGGRSRYFSINEEESDDDEGGEKVYGDEGIYTSEEINKLMEYFWKHDAPEYR